MFTALLFWFCSLCPDGSLRGLQSWNAEHLLAGHCPMRPGCNCSGIQGHAATLRAVQQIQLVQDKIQQCGDIGSNDGSTFVVTGSCETLLGLRKFLMWPCQGSCAQGALFHDTPRNRLGMGLFVEVLEALIEGMYWQEGLQGRHDFVCQSGH